MNILLTSSGLSSPALMSCAENMIAGRRPQSAHIIVTASSQLEEKDSARLAMAQLNGMGIPKVEFFDFQRQSISDLENSQLLYVNGGNTFKLMQEMERQHTHRFMHTFLRRGGLYMGVSAGSCVMGRAIDHLSKVGMDEDGVGYGSRQALGFIPHRILPHDNPEYGQKMDALKHADALCLADNSAVLWNSITNLPEAVYGNVRGLAAPSGPRPSTSATPLRP